jgi:hypothetical protein
VIGALIAAIGVGIGALFLFVPIVPLILLGLLHRLARAPLVAARGHDLIV